MEDVKLQFASSLFMVLRSRGKAAAGSQVTMRDITNCLGVKVMEVFQVRSLEHTIAFLSVSNFSSCCNGDFCVGTVPNLDDAMLVARGMVPAAFS